MPSPGANPVTFTAQLVIESAQGHIARRFRAGSPVLSSPERTREYLRLHLGGLDYEVFGCLWLDSRHRLLLAETLFRGTVDGASVHPREVAKTALSHGASACLLFHNHPLCGITVSPPRHRVTQYGVTPVGAEQVLDGGTVP